MKKTDQQFAQTLWDYMRLDHPLEKADVIIGLGSTDLRTAHWCAKLYRESLAPRILFTGARGRMARDVFKDNEADLFANVAISDGVPESDIIREPKAMNTGENILCSYQALKEIGEIPKKIILVTKPYMLRRAYATFKKQWPDQKCQIICSGVNETFEEYCNNRDYPFDYVVNVMVGDLQRIIEYPKLGFQIKQEVPDEVLNAYSKLVERGYTKQAMEVK